MREIGRVSLLSGDQEVDLAKRIEEGEILIEEAVINSTLLINDLIKNNPKVKTGKIKLTDVLRINRLYYFSSVDLKQLEKKYNENMGAIIAEDKKIVQYQNKLRKADEESKKWQDLKTKIDDSMKVIVDSVRALDINENEITKLSNKIQSMVARIKDTYDFSPRLRENTGKN